ncbi:1964_t:CDS:1, partial [Funneliformis mosseae]
TSLQSLAKPPLVEKHLLENFRGQGLKDERIVRVKLINLVKIIERQVDEIVLSKLKIDDLILA